MLLLKYNACNEKIFKNGFPLEATLVGHLVLCKMYIPVFSSHPSMGGIDDFGRPLIWRDFFHPDSWLFVSSWNLKVEVSWWLQWIFPTIYRNLVLLTPLITNSADYAYFRPAGKFYAYVQSSQKSHFYPYVKYIHIFWYIKNHSPFLQFIYSKILK